MPENQQAVAQFAGAEITAILSADDGLIYASLPALTQAIGLDTDSQRARISEHAVLSEGLRQFDLASSGRVLTTWCLKVSLIPLWLAMVPVGRLKPDKRERVLLYQRQVADVLMRLFGPTQTGMMPVAEQTPYAEGLAITRLALETETLSTKMSELQRTLDLRLAAIEARLEPLAAIETRLQPRANITEEQAQQISDLVKQAGIALSKKLGGANAIGTVYGQLYRMFNVTSYKAITQAQFPKAVQWLENEIKRNREA